MSRGLRNNNPGNIRISGTKYKGEMAQSQDSAFRQFETMAWGYRAMFVLLHTYQVKHGLNTIRAMIGRYAPPIENDTNGYVDVVAKRSGVSADDLINTKNGSIMIPIVAQMSRVENGVEANLAEVKQGWKLFKL